MITYSNTYLQDGPDNKKKAKAARPPQYESLLLVRIDGKPDVVTFKGTSRKEADKRMVGWIRKNKAVEAKS